MRLCIQSENFRDEEWSEDPRIDEFVKNFDKAALAIINTITPENESLFFVTLLC